MHVLKRFQILDFFITIFICGRAYLTRIPELGEYQAIRSFFQVGAVKDHKRRIAAQLKLHLFHMVCTVCQNNLAHRGRTGEADLSHQRMLAQLFAYDRCVLTRRCDYIHTAFRQSSHLGQLIQIKFSLMTFQRPQSPLNRFNQLK